MPHAVASPAGPGTAELISHTAPFIGPAGIWWLVSPRLSVAARGELAPHQRPGTAARRHISESGVDHTCPCDGPTRQEPARPDRIRPDPTGSSPTRQDSARPDRIRLDPAGSGSTRQDPVRPDRIQPDPKRPGTT